MKVMWTILLGTLAIVLAPAFAKAEVRTPVGLVYAVQFDGTNLEVEYSVGGGCQKHRSDVELVFDKSKMEFAVKIVDVTDQYDACEAMIPGVAKVNLKEMIKKMAAQQVPGVSSFTIRLPEINIITY